MEILVPYLFLINAVGFLLMLADKRKAQKSKWRIPERVLIGAALLGGSLGVLMGMRICRHKTKKPKFFLGVPCILLLQILLFIYIYAKNPGIF